MGSLEYQNTFEIFEKKLFVYFGVFNEKNRSTLKKCKNLEIAHAVDPSLGYVKPTASMPVYLCFSKNKTQSSYNKKKLPKQWFLPKKKKKSVEICNAKKNKDFTTKVLFKQKKGFF